MRTSQSGRAVLRDGPISVVCVRRGSKNRRFEGSVSAKWLGMLGLSFVLTSLPLREKGTLPFTANYFISFFLRTLGPCLFLLVLGCPDTPHWRRGKCQKALLGLEGEAWGMGKCK